MLRLAHLLAALCVSCVLLTGCSRDALVNETMAEVTALTNEITAKVTEAEDKQAAIAEAKALLDARRDELQPRLRKISQLRSFQVSEETVETFRGSLVAAALGMSALQVELMMHSAQDPELAAALDELIAAHDELLDLE